MLTIIATVVIPNGTAPKPVATIVYPGGEIVRVTLHDHDWSNDTWPANRSPDSLRRYLRQNGWSNGYHGDRCVYRSPSDVGVDSNEAGRLNVYELDFDRT